MARWQANGWLFVVVAIWGSTFVVVKESLDRVGPFVLVTGRFAVALLPLLAVALWRQRAAWPWRDGALTGLLLAGGFVTQTLGLQSSEASTSAFITGLNVVLVPLFAAWLLRRPPSRYALLGVALATAGLARLTLDEELRLAPGDGWTMLCALFFALHIIAIARYAPRHATLPFTVVQLATVSTLAALAALLWERGALRPDPAALPALIYLGLAATALVFLLQTWAQPHTTPTHTALIFALEPLFAALFALLVLGEALEAREWLGGALILTGMIVAELGDQLAARLAARRGVALPDGA